MRASRSWWDAEAASYLGEHGPDLGDRELQWGPEGLREGEAGLLGDVAGRDVLEFGAGAGQGARWCADRGARAVASDLSRQMLLRGRGLDLAGGPAPAAYLQCDAAALPFADAGFDVVFSAYGALPFTPEGARVLTEAARVVRPGGRVVFSVTHPVRWMLPDVPGEAGLAVTRSYFDRTPYVEQDDTGRPTYVEHHRTLGDRVRDLVAAGLVLVDLVEPEWPEGLERSWGGWSPLRGRLVPGTAVFVCVRPR